MSNRTTWTSEDYGAAMIRCCEERADNIRRTKDGVRCAAFYRGGDDDNLCVSEAKGCYHDQKTGESGGAKDFAGLLGMKLPEFMDRYGVSGVGAEETAKAYLRLQRAGRPASIFSWTRFFAGLRDVGVDRPSESVRDLADALKVAPWSAVRDAFLAAWPEEIGRC